MGVEDVLGRARMLADLGRYEDAEPLLARALAAEPESEDGLSLLARTHVVRGRYPAAAEVTGRLLAAHPDSVRGLTGMARVQCMLGRPREGVTFARRALELHPGNTGCLTTLADVLQQSAPGSAEAMALAERAIELEPEYVQAYLVAADIELGVTQYAAAERWALAALRIRPDDPRAVLELGLARAGLGRFDESRDQVLAALRMNPTSDNIAQVIEHVECRAIPEHLAGIYRMALTAGGRPDLTAPGAAGDDPELIAAQGRLVRRMYSLHSSPAGLRRAGELAEAVLAADPGNQHGRYVRARTLSDAERHAEARPIAEALRAEGYPDADDVLLTVQTGLGEFPAALATVRRVLDREPDSALYLRVQAQCLRELERPGEALASARRAAELSPSGVEVQLQLGLSAKAAGDPVLAERALRAAVDHQPAEGVPVAELALLLAQTDRWPEAERLMATLHRDLPDLRRALGPVGALATATLLRAVPAMSELDPAGPEESLLDEGAHWLDLALDMYSIVVRGYSKGAREFSGMLTEIQSALHTIAAPPENAFARVVRRLDTLMAAWQSA